MDSQRQDQGEDTTQNTNLSSSVSNLSILENDTDEFGRQLLEHARRDRQRMNDATNGAGVQAFKKARPRPGIALTMENLERNNASTSKDLVSGGRHTAQRSTDREREQDATRRHTSVDESDRSSPPSVNVPQQWGRKGRQRNDFLRRISAPPAVSPGGSPVLNKDADSDTIYRRRTILTGDSPRSDVDWTEVDAEVDAVLPSVEQDSPLRKVLTYGASSVTPERNTSIERILELERDDAPGAESPTSEAENRRRLASNSHHKEIKDVKERGVTTTRLNHIGEGASRRRLPSSKAVRNADGPANGNVDGMAIESAVLEQETAKSSVVAFKSAKGVLMDGESQKNLSDERSPGDLLKELANVASYTPSPTSKNGPKRPAEDAQRTAGSSLGKRASLIPIASQDSTQRQRPPLAEEPAPQLAESLLPKIPLVTGAWIDTPAKPPSNPGITMTPDANPSPPEQVQEPVAEQPHQPPSAAAALLESSNPQSLDLSTLASLRSLLADPDTPATALDDETLDLIQHIDFPVNSAQARDDEMQTLARMDERLRAARTGLRDASRGLKRVEKEVEDAVEESEERDRVGSFIVTKCAACDGVTLGGLIRDASKRFTRRFYVWESWHRPPRLTWLGLVCFLVFAWCVSEVTLCEYYCHPLYASSMSGYGVNLNAPRMPYVTGTVLLKQPFAWLWKPAWFWAVWIWELWSGAGGAAQHVKGGGVGGAGDLDSSHWNGAGIGLTGFGGDDFV